MKYRKGKIGTSYRDKVRGGVFSAGRRSGTAYWQKLLVLLAAVFVVFTLLRPTPEPGQSLVQHESHEVRPSARGQVATRQAEEPTERTTEEEEEEEEEERFSPIPMAGFSAGERNDSRISALDSPLSFVPRYGCPSIAAKRKLDVNGNVSSVAMLKVLRSTYITKFRGEVAYAHMAMIEKIRMPDGKLKLVSAWQAAPRAPSTVNPRNGERYQRVAVEGLPMQRLYWATSDDEGRTWSESQMVPPDEDAKTSAYWSPVLFYDEKKSLLWLFYAVSNSCQKLAQNTTLWEPGGDIRAKVMGVGAGQAHVGRGLDVPSQTWTWGEGRTILKEEVDGDVVPKVIANKPTVLANGDWVMPFWREQPPSENNGTCSKEADFKSRYMYGHIANRTSSGVLISTDDGLSWNPFGNITEPRTNLIEGSLVEVRPNGNLELHLYFRAIVGCVFRSISFDNGRTWSRPEPLPISNPNTKFSIIQIHPFQRESDPTPANPPNSLLVMAFNNHKRGQLGCLQCRTHLHLAASTDYGNTWTQIAIIENEFVEGVRIHYPTMLQTGQNLHLIYSRFYLGKYNLDKCKIDKGQCLGLYSRKQGIKFVTLNITSLYAIPQLYTEVSENTKLIPSVQRLLTALIDIRLGEIDKQEDGDAKLKKIQHFKDLKWFKVVNMIMNNFDVTNLGGIHEVRKQKQLFKFFKQVLNDRLQSRFGNGLLLPEHEQKCTCSARHPFTGSETFCPCNCKDDEKCVLLCFLGIANCGTQQLPGNSSLARNHEEGGSSKRRRSDRIKK